MSDPAARARALDAADPLAHLRGQFLPAEGVVSYLDGNSLGRPTAAAADRIDAFVRGAWANRLIRGWAEPPGWLDLPLRTGDRIGAATLGAAPGQVSIGDSTTVLLYKLCHGALTLRPGRTEIVLDTDNFPTDRYILESIAAERNMTLRWITSDVRAGVTAEQVRAVVGERTALVLLSHVAYRSGFVLDAPAVVEAAHDAGAVVLLDLSHSVGSVELDLDGWGVDLAVGCTYKYLCGGPGSPAFAYVAARHLGEFEHPVRGWLGRADAFEMGPGYVPAEGIRRVISGTPPILSMLAVADTLDLIESVGMPAIRAKSVALTEFVVEMVESELVPLGVELASPRESARRGGHVTIDHPSFRELVPRLWEQGVIPDFRAPHGLRIGPGPLSTSFDEVRVGLHAVRVGLDAIAHGVASGPLQEG